MTKFPSSKHLSTWQIDSPNASPLTKAILEGKHDLFHDLISQGTDLNATDDIGRTALMSAAYEGDNEISRVLIDAGADVNQKNRYNHTALFYSVAHNREEVTKLLMENGAYVNARDKYRETPLFLAAENNSDKIAGMLIEKGASINVLDIFDRTPLEIAARNSGNENVARLLIENGADINVSQKYHYHPLFIAASNQNPEIARLMIEKGADVNVSSEYGTTPLFCAARNSNEEVAQLLIDKGADVNVPDKYGETPLFDAARNSNKLVAKLLIEKGAAVNWGNKHGETPLFCAAANTNKDVALLLIDKGACVNAYSHEFQDTPLFRAAANINEEIARLLIEKGADVNEYDYGLEQTPLFDAAINTNEEVARLLIENDADVNVLDDLNRTPLFYAAEHTNKEVAQMLIEGGCDVDGVDDFGKTPLFFAAKNTKQEVARLLIEKGADISKSDRNFKTALFPAAKNSNQKVARLLIEKGADVNRSDAIRQTPLFRAAKNTNDDVARLLIEKGASVNVRDIYKKTPLFFAAENTNVEVARLLIEKGADVNVSSADGRTPLFFAAKNKNVEVARLLIEKGADVNQCDKDGQTPIFSAAKNINEEAYLLLKSYRADVQKADKYGRTALFYLTGVFDYHTRPFARDKASNIVMAQMALEVIFDCEDINKKDNDGRTALSYCIDAMCKRRLRDESLAQILVDAGANVNIADDKGQTPLFYAFTASAVRFLYEHGADFGVRNNEQETALINAVRNTGIVDLKSDFYSTLFNCGKQEVNSRDIHGRTALFYAVTTCRTIEKLEVIVSTLIDNGADLNVTDNSNVNVLGYYIERYCVDRDYLLINEEDLNDEYLLDFEYPYEYVMSKGIITFFKEKGIQNPMVFRSALNFLYASLPNYLHQKGKEICQYALSIASKYASDQELKHIKNLKDALVKNNIPEALDALMMLSVNPNSADSYGNTALHYATLLPFYGVSQECVMKILQTLEKQRVRFNVKNKYMETPLHFCLSEKAWELAKKKGTWDGITTVIEICKFLLKDGSLISATTRGGETVYHLIMKLFQKGLSVNDEEVREIICLHAVKLLEMFSKITGINSLVLKKLDNKMNSPLHLWASLSLPPNQNYEEHITKDLTFQMLLDTTLKHLLKPEVSPNTRNDQDQTPLHLSKTWAAVKLLIEVGANINDLDKKRRPPLLNVANDKQKPAIFSDSPKRFFPDVEDDPKQFFETCVSLGLDISTSDKEGLSILSICLHSKAYVLAKALIDVVVARCNSTTILKQFVDTVCKDESTDITWKSLLIEKLIISSNIPSNLNLDDALRHTCTNIDKLQNQGHPIGIEEVIECDEPPTKKPRMNDAKDNSALKSNVFVDIARQLLFYGADGNSLCKDFPALCSLLTTKIKPDQMKKIIPWTSHSKTHKDKLETVSRKQDVDKIGTYCFHKEPIGQGSFGEVYAGICESDAREVAIKKIKKSLARRPVDEREKSVLVELADCQQVVQYISFDDCDKDFVYIVLELMEGHLDDYLVSRSIDGIQSQILCKDVAKGLRYLHQHKPKPILHRDLKPENILYKFDTNGKLCLKISDFGLSSPLTTSRTTVLPTKAATRNWIAPEVTCSQPYQYFESSDVFCCGLLFHYILSKKKHPFSPADCTNMSFEVIVHKTQDNMLKFQMEGWDDSVSPEATHLIKGMLQQDHTKRPSAAESLCHPFFWSNKKKMEFLSAVGNQYEFECPAINKAASYHVTTGVEADLEHNLATIVRFAKWDDANYRDMAKVVSEMNIPIAKVDKHGRIRSQHPRNYNTVSVVELVRFIRNANAHVSESSRPSDIRKLILEEFVFLKEFPHLLIEVYKAVTTHGWDTREEIKYAMHEIC